MPATSLALGAGGGCRLFAWCFIFSIDNELAACRVPVLGAGAGAGAGCGAGELAVRVVETGCRCSVLVPVSDSEVITTAASDSEGRLQQ